MKCCKEREQGGASGVRRVNYKEDFEVTLTMRRNGEVTAWPEGDFEVTFRTSQGSYTVGREQGETRRCRVTNDGRLRCFLDGHGLGVGRLKYEVRVKHPDTDYEDGTRLEVLVGQGDAELWSGNTTGGDVEMDVDYEVLTVDAYELAVRNGYKGTIEEYYGTFAELTETLDIVVTAENARAAAEQQRENHEVERENNEHARREAEIVRVAQEQARQTAMAGFASRMDRIEQGDAAVRTVNMIQSRKVELTDTKAERLSVTYVGNLMVIRLDFLVREETTKTDRAVCWLPDGCPLPVNVAEVMVDDGVSVWIDTDGVVSVSAGAPLGKRYMAQLLAVADGSREMRLTRHEPVWKIDFATDTDAYEVPAYVDTEVVDVSQHVSGKSGMMLHVKEQAVDDSKPFITLRKTIAPGRYTAVWEGVGSTPNSIRRTLFKLAGGKERIMCLLVMKAVEKWKEDAFYSVIDVAEEIVNPPLYHYGVEAPVAPEKRIVGVLSHYVRRLTLYRGEVDAKDMRLWGTDGTAYFAGETRKS